MSKTSIIWNRFGKIGIATLVATAIAGGVTVLAQAVASFGSPQPVYPISFEGIVPATKVGNFVSTDNDQVCYDMSALGYIGAVDGEMIGIKVDPPVAYTSADGTLNTLLSADGRYLAWAIEGIMHAVIMKGGPNYHVYNYVGTGETSDSWLVSPKNGRNIPAVSHYNVCYTPDLPDGGNQGCTPGYWRNHGDRWVDAAPGDDFDATFGVDLFTPNITLGQAIWASGGGVDALARHATAALLNSYGGVPNGDGTTVAYPYDSGYIIALVQGATATVDDPTTMANETAVAIESAKDILAAANELGCPLAGTSANPVPGR